MKTNDIRRVIDASLSGLALTAQQRSELLNRALGDTKSAAPPRHKLVRWFAVAALIVLLMLALLVPAVGGSARQEEVVDEGDAIAFHYDRIDGVTSYSAGTDLPEEIASIWGAEFTAMLRLYGAQALLPKWVPEGYEPSGIDVYFDARTIRLYMRKVDERDIDLSVMVFDDSILSFSSWVESIEGTAETWTYDGIDYNYSENYESSSVVWFENNCRVHLSGPRDRELMLRMIESIYE